MRHRPGGGPPLDHRWVSESAAGSWAPPEEVARPAEDSLGWTCTGTGVEGCEEPEAEAGTGGCRSWAGFGTEAAVGSVTRAGPGVACACIADKWCGSRVPIIPTCKEKVVRSLSL